MAQLSAGWQFADPLAIRRVEMAQALIRRYHNIAATMPATVTLEPGAIFAGERSGPEPTVAVGQRLQPLLDAAQSSVVLIDVLLDAEHVPVSPNPHWPRQFEEFAGFLASDPTGPEMKRQRTNLKFLADLQPELVIATQQSRLTHDQFSGWLQQHCSHDIERMPALGMFREVMHDKLCDPKLRWESNDLTDMMYLTAAAGYCDHVVGERRHIAHMRQGLKRLGRADNLHTKLRTLIPRL